MKMSRGPILKRDALLSKLIGGEVRMENLQG
jgi:hypothetical protein